MSSPYNPQSNGFAEAAVKTIKHLLQKVSKNGNLESDEFRDPVLEVRNTPGADGPSPAHDQKLYGRFLRTRLPTHPDSLQPASVTRSGLGSEKGQSDSGKALRRLLLGETVRVQNPKSLRWDESATVVGTTRLGRSYHVQTAQGTVFRRNRKFLRPVDFAQ